MSLDVDLTSLVSGTFHWQCPDLLFYYFIIYIFFFWNGSSDRPADSHTMWGEEPQEPLRNLKYSK